MTASSRNREKKDRAYHKSEAIVLLHHVTSFSPTIENNLKTLLQGLEQILPRIQPLYKIHQAYVR